MRGAQIVSILINQLMIYDYNDFLFKKKQTNVTLSYLLKWARGTNKNSGYSQEVEGGRLNAYWPHHSPIINTLDHLAFIGLMQTRSEQQLKIQTGLLLTIQCMMTAWNFKKRREEESSNSLTVPRVLGKTLEVSYNSSKMRY